ncbi:MAG: dihydroorotate dehydrogenase [Candidatus Eisenbacteria bacterium]|nr:dihydroorotate dehydrogenase [Candidatus Eisenbacteria bacterium]
MSRISCWRSTPLPDLGTPLPDLGTVIGKLQMRTPVMLASGTVGYGPEYEGLIDLGAVGALITKTVTLRPRAGNKPPRLCETPGGLLNAIGLENVGLDRFVAEKLPEAGRLPVPIVASIAGTTAAECARLADALGECPEIQALELNVSCPNVGGAKTPVWADPVAVSEFTAATRAATAATLIVKLSPNVTDITAVAEAAERAGADALTVANTMPGMRIDLSLMKPSLANVTGGLSGRALMPVNLALVWKVAGCVAVPILGCGGITSAEDALEFMAAGATAVQVGTAVFADPDVPIRIAEGLNKQMSLRGLSRIREFVGMAREETKACELGVGTD